MKDISFVLGASRPYVLIANKQEQMLVCKCLDDAGITWASGRSLLDTGYPRCRELQSGARAICRCADGVGVATKRSAMDSGRVVLTVNDVCWR